MFVKPTPGLKVRDPETRAFLPNEGREVPASIYWTRRLRDGDVVKATPVAAPGAVQAAPAAKAMTDTDGGAGK